MIICCEVKCAHLLSFFRGIPRDSCILMPDNDDLFETSRTIDECAPGCGFLFGTDRCWISPGDVKQNMIDVFNFAHEYSKK